jgi:trigger factor
MKKDETREVVKTYPADSSDSSLAGQTKKLRVTLTALKEKKLPDLDDDLAQDVDEKYKTLEDLKNSIRERLGKNLDQRLRDLKINGILEKIVENTPLEIPESMIRIEMEGRWRNLGRQFGSSAEDIIKMMARSGKNPEEVQEEWRPAAVKALHSRLIVETLIEEQGFTADDGELEKEFETMANGGDTPFEDIKKYYEQENLREYLREEIKERKLFDVLLSENTIKPGKKEKYLDLMKNNG